MTELTALWLPILLSAIAVFIVSSLIHMVLPWHKGDYPRLANQDKIMDALRPFNIPPGDYMLPRANSAAEMKSPEFTEKLKQGPVMMMTVMPSGPIAMGASLVQWFVFALIVTLFAAYIAGRALPVGADYLQVFRFIGASAFMGYTFAYWPMSIWYKRSWGITVKMTVDGLIYALVSAGVFGWLWPR